MGREEVNLRSDTEVVGTPVLYALFNLLAIQILIELAKATMTTSH